jgi:DNA-binding response OmpR family regulator
LKKNILLVDDDPDITSSFKIGLEQNGFAVVSFNDPKLAFSQFKEGLYDLLLTDIRMPGMNGLELYEKIKKLENRIKVCFVTAFEEYYGELEKAFPMLNLHKCYILKPITISDLAKKVNVILNLES